MPTLPSAVAAEAAAAVNTPFFMAYLDVAGDPLWAWTGQADITVTLASDPLLASGRLFVGAGDVGSVSSIVHNSDGSVAALTLTLGSADFADPSTYDFANFVDRWSQRLAVVWMGFYTVATGAIIGPVRLATMRMVHVATTDGAKPSIVVKLASKSATDGQRANGWQLADAHQQAFYPGDKALIFVPQLVGKELRFGTPDDKIARPSSGSVTTRSERSIDRFA